MIIIDAKNLIVGRMATFVAKQALLGESIEIINCKDAVITGKRDRLLKDNSDKVKKGIPLKGPYYSRLPSRYVRRMIRGMLPFKNTRGREAYKRIMCYTDMPSDLDMSKVISMDNANVSKLPNLNYMKIGEICKLLGSKHA